MTRPKPRRFSVRRRKAKTVWLSMIPWMRMIECRRLDVADDQSALDRRQTFEGVTLLSVPVLVLHKAERVLHRHMGGQERSFDGHPASRVG